MRSRWAAYLAGVFVCLPLVAVAQTDDGSKPIRRTTREIMREEALRERPTEVQDREIKKTPIDWSLRRQNPKALPVSRWPEGGPEPFVGAPAPLAPQTVSTPNFTSVTTDDAPTIPPDSMGAIGPTQFLTHVNGRVRVHDKGTGATGALNSDDFVFWTPVVEDPIFGFVSDPRVRYDRLSDRWFMIILDIPGDAGTNGSRILLAVSDGPTITAGTVWQYFYFDQDLALPTGQAGCLADYPTLGIDVNALYIGANVFCGPDLNNLFFDNTTLWVVRKSTLLNPATPANLVSTAGTVTAFRRLLNDSTFEGIYTPMGVDNYDPAATTGYVVGVDGAFFSQIDVRKISNPGSGAPTLGPTLTLTVPTTTFPQDVFTPGGGAALDGLDDRLLAAHVRNGRLWTAHQIEVNASGVASTSGNRNGERWYEIDVSGATPSLIQSGTVFDPAASNPQNYWMGTVMVSGQGHAALGFTRANAVTIPGAATVGRLASDAAGTTQGTPVLYKAGEANYVISNGRWGDYSMTSLDPCDDMTMWTIQEYGDTPNVFTINWGVQVVRLLAPGPATPTSATPSSVFTGQASVNVTINASAAAGTGFYDTPAAGMSACRTRIGASVTNGVVVNSVTWVDADTVTLNLDTRAAAPGLASVTVTNPDGQSSTGNNLLTLVPTPVLAGTKVVSGNFDVGGTVTYTVVITNSGSGTQANNPGDEFTDTLPSTLTLVSANATSGTSGTVGNTVNWNGSLAPGGSVTITITATINTGTESQVVNNQGTISYDSDANGTNDTLVLTDDPGSPGSADPTGFLVGSGALQFFTLSPCRVIDTRNPVGPLGGPALVGQSDRTFALVSSCGIPSSAKAVSVNLAVTQPTGIGNLRIRPAGLPPPAVSSINFTAGQTRSNNAVVPLNASGEIAVFVGGSTSSVHFILDANGYFE